MSDQKQEGGDSGSGSGARKKKPEQAIYAPPNRKPPAVEERSLTGVQKSASYTSNPGQNQTDSLNNRNRRGNHHNSGNFNRSRNSRGGGNSNNNNSRNNNNNSDSLSRSSFRSQRAGPVDPSPQRGDGKPQGSERNFGPGEGARNFRRTRQDSERSSATVGGRMEGAAGEEERKKNNKKKKKKGRGGGQQNNDFVGSKRDEASSEINDRNYALSQSQSMRFNEDRINKEDQKFRRFSTQDTHQTHPNPSSSRYHNQNQQRNYNRGWDNSHHPASRPPLGVGRNFGSSNRDMDDTRSLPRRRASSPTPSVASIRSNRSVASSRGGEHRRGRGGRGRRGGRRDSCGSGWGDGDSASGWTDTHWRDRRQPGGNFDQRNPRSGAYDTSTWHGAGPSTARRNQNFDRGEEGWKQNIERRQDGRGEGRGGRRGSYSAREGRLDGDKQRPPETGSYSARTYQEPETSSTWNKGAVQFDSKTKGEEKDWKKYVSVDENREKGHENQSRKYETEKLSHQRYSASRTADRKGAEEKREMSRNEKPNSVRASRSGTSHGSDSLDFNDLLKNSEALASLDWSAAVEAAERGEDPAVELRKEERPDTSQFRYEGGYVNEKDPSQPAAPPQSRNFNSSNNTKTRARIPQGPRGNYGSLGRQGRGPRENQNERIHQTGSPPPDPGTDSGRFRGGRGGGPARAPNPAIATYHQPRGGGARAQLPPRFQRQLQKQQRNLPDDSPPERPPDEPSKVPGSQGGTGGRITLPRGITTADIERDPTLINYEYESQQRFEGAKNSDNLEPFMGHIVDELLNRGNILGQLLANAEAQRHFDMPNIMGYRQQLLLDFRLAVVQNLDFTFKKSLEHLMWKNCFYQLVETLRVLLSWTEDRNMQANLASLLINLIDEGVQFYEQLVKEYEEKYHFTIKDQFFEMISKRRSTRRYSESLNAPAADGISRKNTAMSDEHFPPLQSSAPATEKDTPAQEPDHEVSVRPSSRTGEPPDPSTTFNVDLLGCLVQRRESKTHYVKVALMSCQRFIISLGDLERYKCLIMKETDYIKARSWYLKAVQLSPGSGRPYNQLGLLAYYTNRKLDQIYFYLRSLAAKHPYTTAQQSVFVALEEIHAKVVIYERELKKQVHESLILAAKASGLGVKALGPARQLHGGNINPDLTTRTEIWIGGTSTDGEGEKEGMGTESEKEREILTKAATNQVYKRMIVYFMEATRMLITKINMEQFESIAEKALLQLQELLLNRPQSPLDAFQLVQLATLALYCVHDIAKSEKGSAEDSAGGGRVKGAGETCTVRFNQAVQFAFSLWGLLLEVVEKFLQIPQHLSPRSRTASDGTSDTNEPQAGKPPRVLPMVLPAMRIMSMWVSLTQAYDLYSTLSSLDGLDTQRFRVPIWESLASLCNKLTAAEQSQLLIQSKSSPGNIGFEKAVILPEELCSGSFFTIYESKPPLVYISPDTDLEEAGFHIRLRSILQAGSFVHGMELPYFTFNQEHGFMATGSEARSSATPPPAAVDPLRESGSLENTPESSAGRASVTAQHSGSIEDTLSSEIGRMHIQRSGEEQKRALIDKESQNQGLQIEVTPQFIVPDTNTFIDHLSSLKSIFSSKRYIVSVPVIVLNELRGLSQNEENEWVSSQAAESLNYLETVAEQQIGGRRKILESVTSKGTRFTSVGFFNEDTDTRNKVRSRFLGSRKIRTAMEEDLSGNDQDINDDKILRSCIDGFCKESGSREIRDLRNEPLIVKRNVVLLTEDKALRIKATIANVPVRSIESFVRWAGIK